MIPTKFDAIIVGSGPNGLAGAVRLAEAGASVLVLEGAETIGGGMRTEALTQPGFKHDVCSTVHPLALASPYFRQLDLSQHGVRWIHPPIPLAHPLDDGTAVRLERSVEATACRLGRDEKTYLRLMQPFLNEGMGFFDDLLGPLHLPGSPFAYARFGWIGFSSAERLARRFKTGPARALLAGLAAHSMLPLNASLTGAIGMVLALLAHQVGWPFSEGGSQKIAEALAGNLRANGGVIETGTWVEHIEALPQAKIYMLNTSARNAIAMVGERLTGRYRAQLQRYRYGPGVFKIDYALDGPIPWRALDCHRAGTLHLGGTFEEIAAAEQAVWAGKHPAQPFVLLTQPSLFDPERAPEGRHTAWAYCHVPHGSTSDMTAAIEAQIERFAPGFSDRILVRRTMNAVEMESYNPNYVGGDINGGVQDWRQFFSRPALRRVPYATSDPGIFLCSSATPPGGGVHGMCGYFAAEAARRQLDI